MKEWIKLLFGIRKPEIEDSRAMRNEALELFKIADSNVRLIQGTISTKKAMLNWYGIREARKKQHIIDKLYQQLVEQQHWAIEYGNAYTELKLKVDEETRQRKESKSV